MTQPKMRTVNFALSYAKPIQFSNDIKLLSYNETKDGEDHNTWILESDNLIQKKIPVGQNFFYKIEKVSCQTVNQKCLTREYGVGELTKQGKSYILKREMSISFYDGVSEYKVPSNSFHRYDPEDLLIVKSTIPTNFIEAFVYPYSILCSIEEFTPTPVELQEKTLIGRLDGTIQSIDKDELRQIFTDENIVDAISKNKEELNINSTINIINKEAKLASPVITIKPDYSNTTKPKNPQRGSIIFNADENCFEGYDGRRWRRLKWSDE